MPIFYRPKNDPKAKSVYDFIIQYRRAHGVSPTLREISKGCNLSLSGVVSYLDSLQAWGKIIRHPKMARGIMVVEDPD